MKNARYPVFAKPPNDIEFSGERKRVRCNELLDRTFGALPLPDGLSFTRERWGKVKADFLGEGRLRKQPLNDGTCDDEFVKL